MRSLPAVFSMLVSTAAAGRNPTAQPAGTPADNPRMTAICAADQAARQCPATIDWKAVSSADAARRAETQDLLDAGKLASADDFHHAAFVFQHGETAEDRLKAHALAVAAAAREKQRAAWIAAATLDRYLQRIGQPQIYGTQFLHPEGRKWTQEPYRRDLIPDSLRIASGVLPLSVQEGRLREWEREAP